MLTQPADRTLWRSTSGCSPSLALPNTRLKLTARVDCGMNFLQRAAAYARSVRQNARAHVTFRYA
jgi:hypothetical protein